MYLNEDDKLGQKDEEFPGMESFYRFVERYDEDMQKVVAAAGDGITPDPKDGARRQYDLSFRALPGRN